MISGVSASYLRDTSPHQYPVHWHADDDRYNKCEIAAIDRLAMVSSKDRTWMKGISAARAIK